MKYIQALIFCAVCALAVSAPSSSAVEDIADRCIADKCKIEDNCKCSSNLNPLEEGEAPQLISLTFDEAIVLDAYNAYWQPLLFNRLNPDKLPIGGTFFVPHEYTNYRVVNKLYNAGFEIGVHTVTKNPLQEYWRTASLDTLTHEFGDQKQIISLYANITADEIQGARTPQLQMQGNNTIEAYKAAQLGFDSSWPTLPNKPLFPYTLDYKSSQQCSVSVTCPNEPFPGFWVLPIIDLNGNGTYCNALTTCNFQGSADDFANWLLGEVDNVRTKSNKAPMTLRLNSNLFSMVEHSYEGFRKFLDALPPDVFLVSQKQVIEWMKKPVPLDAFQTDNTSDRVDNCHRPSTCPLMKGTEMRYLMTCTGCPEVYPWLGNPEGKAQ